MEVPVSENCFFLFFDSLFEGSERDTELRCFFLLFEMNKYYYYATDTLSVYTRDS